MEFIFFVGGIVGFILLMNLRGRVMRLEQMAINGYERQATPAASNPQPLTESLSVSLAQPSEPITLTAQPEGMTLGGLAAWLKEDWLLKLGAMLLLIGFGWLTTYAFLNNWVGPAGRITLGIIAGVLFIVLGWVRIKKYLEQGGVFLVLGSTTILLTIYAAREIYDFFTPLSALIVMFLSTSFVALASVKYNNRGLALASLVLAGIAPMLTDSPTTNYVGLFSYLFVVTIGALWVVALTGRRELTTAALLMIFLYSLPHLLNLTTADEGQLLLFAYAFAAVFFLSNIAGALKSDDKHIVPDLVSAGGNGLFLLAWILVAVDDEWKSLVIASWMVVFTVGAFLVYRASQRREPFYVNAGVGIAMLAAATSAELNGATLIIAYTIECGVVALISYFVVRDIKVAERSGLLFIAPIILSMESITSRAWLTGILHKDFFVLLTIGLTMLGLGVFFLHRVREVDDHEPRQLNTTILIVGSVYIYALLWLSLHSWLRNDNTAVMISLVIYTIIGLITYFYGLWHEKKVLRAYGGVLVGFVVGRLLFIDIWDMELAGRIVTFFLIGALLVSTAFLGRTSKSVISDNT